MCRKRSLILIGGLVLLTLVFLGSTTTDVRGDHASPEVLERRYEAHSYRALSRDGFPVPHNPDPNGVLEADRELRDQQWVLGGQVNGRARAYPLSQMGVHELVNDTLGGLPIAICW